MSDYNRWPSGILNHIQPGTFRFYTYRPLSLLWRVLGFFGVYRSCE